MTGTLRYRERKHSVILRVLAMATAGGVVWSLLADKGWGSAAALAVASVTLAWFSTATYEVTDRELRVRMGPGIPHVTIDAASIESVQQGGVNVVKAGGLGWRGSWTLAKRVVVSLGGIGSVTVRVRPRGVIALSSDHAAEFEAAIRAMRTDASETPAASG